MINLVFSDYILKPNSHIFILTIAIALNISAVLLPSNISYTISFIDLGVRFCGVSSLA
jgi:hypothetical protein